MAILKLSRLRNVLHAEQIIGSYAAGHEYRLLIAPFFLLGFELFLWFKMFRYAAHPSRLFAGVVGAYILCMIVFVNLVIADMSENDVNGFLLSLCAFAGLGHLLYATIGKEIRY